MMNIDDFTLADLVPVLDTAMRSQEAAADKILDDQRTRSLSDSLYRDASERMNAIDSESPYCSQWACRSGCSACCHQSIPVTAVEALSLADHLRQELSAEELSVVLPRLRENTEKYRSLSPRKLGSARIRCAFLDARESCSVYAARPLRCQGYHSLSATKCESVYNGQDDEFVPVDPHTTVSMRGVQAGLSGAIQRSGRDGGYYELHSAVLCALETSDARRRWENGEDVFVACTPTAAVPNDVWIAPQEDGTVVKLRRTRGDQAEPSMQLVLINENGASA